VANSVGAFQRDYKNPIIDADYSDPDVIRVGDDFYLTASSFNCVPGLPILHSKDLVNWKIIGHALKHLPPADVFARPQHGNGVWAPAIRFHNNYFYIFYGDPDFGIYMVKARESAGSMVIVLGTTWLAQAGGGAASWTELMERSESAFTEITGARVCGNDVD
jgi:beta-xylosidase